MKKKCLLSIFFGLSLFIHALQAQVDTLWTKTFGDEGWDYGQAVQQTTDGGYIVVGTTGADYLHNADVFLIKTDDTGQAEWTKTIGRSHEYGTDGGKSVQQTTDGGYVITGHSSLPEENHTTQVYLVRTDASGDTLWTRTFGDSLSDGGVSVRQTSDGGYVITGWTCSYGAGGSDLFLLKTDAAGVFEWTSTFGGPFDDAGYSVRQTTDGGYVVTGYTSSPSGGYADVYLVKTGPSGVAEWEKTYGGSQDEVGYSVLQVTGGGYLVAGSTGSFGMGGEDVYLVRTDTAGDTLWTRTFGGYGDDVGSSLAETPDGGFVIAGGTDSFRPGDTDVYLVRTDPSGSELWSWIFGGTLDEFSNCVGVASDGGYVITGDIGSRNGEFWDAYLIRVSSEYAGIGDGPSSSSPVPESATLFPNYPNPFNPQTTITFDLAGAAGEKQHVDLVVYDVRGRRVRTLIDSDLEPGSHSVAWSGRDESGIQVSSGMYLYTLRVGESKFVRKMTILK